MTERQGAFTIPTRLYLSPEQRRRLDRLLRDQELDLAELVSEIVAGYLDALPEPPAPADAPPDEDRAATLRQRRAELARLRDQRDAAGAHAPAWLGAYIAELEAELRRLE